MALPPGEALCSNLAFLFVSLLYLFILETDIFNSCAFPVPLFSSQWCISSPFEVDTSDVYSPAHVLEKLIALPWASISPSQPIHNPELFYLVAFSMCWEMDLKGYSLDLL